MQVEFLNAQQVGEKLKKLIASTDKFYWAVAWATDITFANKLLQNEEKICQLVIGTDFSQTSPEVLRTLQEVENVYIMPSNGNATFHPKVFCFVKGKKVYAIVGSSNLTRGGTYRNEEASIFMRGTVDDEPLQEILDAVSSWWDEGIKIEDDWLNAYELRWANNQKHKEALEKPPKIYQPRPNAEHSDLLFKTWDDYVADMYDSMEEERIDNRLKTLRHAHKLFADTNSFNQLNEFQRKAIAGIIGDKEILGTGLEPFKWGAFGFMGGSGHFRNLINNKNQHISQALDYIPLTGEVVEDDYIKFKDEFKKNEGAGIAIATRLLAMKRPDYFVCINNKNKKGLCADIGFPHTRLNLENYWERVVEPITQSRWWNEQRPANDERMIWNTRAAMLDVIYYEFKNN